MSTNYELEKKREAYELKLAHQVERFAKRVSAGLATPDEIAFMSKVADLLDVERKRELGKRCWDVSLAASKLKDAV